VPKSTIVKAARFIPLSSCLVRNASSLPAVLYSEIEAEKDAETEVDPEFNEVFKKVKKQYKLTDVPGECKG
jgi:hypothetical protein